MPKTIAEKIDFLMKLTNTRNSDLGQALNFDASYISRIRKGSRNLPTHKSFIGPASAFLARHITEAYQKDAMAKLTACGGQWPADVNEAAAFIAAWLEAPPDGRPVSMPLPAQKEPERDADEKSPVRFFYGNEGKRQAVKAFLSALLLLRVSPPPLFLFSDEAMLWLYERDGFAREWAELLVAYIRKGGRIKIVHTIKRDIGEMMEAVRKWTPLYATGAIESYYCPRIRDYIFRRSLFIAAGHSAIVSASIESRTEDMVNLLIAEPQAVAALEKEFVNYLSLCRPLFSIFTPKNFDTFLQPIGRLMRKDGGLIVHQPFPLWGVMPRTLAQKISRRADCPAFAKACENAHRRLLELLAAGQTVTEILRLPPPDEVRQNGVALPLTDFLAMQRIILTAEEAADLISTAASFMEKRNGYRIVLEKGGEAFTMSGMSKENDGTLLFSSQPPSVAFYAETPDISESYYEYLKRLASSGEKKPVVLKKLRRYEEALRLES